MKKHIGLTFFIVIIVALIIIALLPTDEDKYLKDVSMSEVTKMIDKKKDFILYVKQTNCEHCKVFTPRFASALKEFKQEAYVINITNLSDDENDIFKKTVGVDGTPTVLFYKSGEKGMITIEGEQTKDRIKSKLKSAGFTENKR